MLAPAFAAPIHALPAVGTECVHFRHDGSATAAPRGKRKIDGQARSVPGHAENGVHAPLLRGICFRTSTTVSQLDRPRLLAKQDRSSRKPGDWFLHERALEDCVERLQLTGGLGRIAIVGYPASGHALPRIPNAQSVDHFALEALEPGFADVVIAVGVLDHAEDPAIAAFVLRHSLRPGGRLIGAAIGSGSLPNMRSAFLEAERAGGRVARRFHRLLDPASLSALLTGAGLRDVVIDVDALQVRYDGLDHLVRDLRSMGCTNSLAGAVPPLGRAVYESARNFFSGGAHRVEERFEILHFSGVA